MVLRLALLFWFIPASWAFIGVSQSVQSSRKILSTPRSCSVMQATRQKNIFENYDMPIVLVGCSGEGDELQRLAESFVSENFPSLENGVISLAADNVVSDIMDKKYKWPQIVVADFSTLSDSESSFETVKRLYDNGMLSVFVNVDSENGNMVAKSKETKSKLEANLFLTHTDYELCIKDEGSLADASSEWEHIQWELTRLLARARVPPAIPGSNEPTVNSAALTMGDHTFFLSLSFPEISQVEPFVEEMCVDVDAMEYRADLLAFRDSRFDLIYGMQLLRRYCRPHVVRVPALPFSSQMIEDVMPIVYTVRTQNQAGTYPDDEEGIQIMFEMLEWGLRGGVEVLDVESAWDPAKTDSLLSKAEERYSSQILGSEHVVGKEISIPDAVELFQQCALDGRAHGAKVVLSIESDDDSRMAHEAAVIASSFAERDGKPVIPNISLILGDVGRFSRVVNLPFTPVTHESLPVKAAPGQMSASEIMAARVLMKIITGMRYCILGHNIAYSVSPQMQGAAFAAARLPHRYLRADVETVEEFVDSDFFKDPLFGGCSVTIPHKQTIIPFVDVMSPAATAIGSVNTLVVREEVKPDENEETTERVIYGDNTDWKGIFKPIQRKLGNQSDGKGIALILGGGGTARAAAYASNQLGLKPIFFNRTPSKASTLADEFNGLVATALDEEGTDEGNLGSVLQPYGPIKVVISTLPAAAEFTLPAWIVSSFHPIIFDVNYKPYQTKLLTQAEDAGCEVVRGSEMLWEQGIGQFEAWTKRTAPYGVMKAVVLQNCNPETEIVIEKKEKKVV